jgi:hypothetical protein
VLLDFHTPRVYPEHDITSVREKTVMDAQTALWLNRLGLLLDLLAFFFAAPELLGGRRLLAVEDVYQRGMRLLPPLALLTALTALAAFLGAVFWKVSSRTWDVVWAASVVTITAVLLTLLGIVGLRLLGRAASIVVVRLQQTEGADVGQRFLTFGAFLFVLGMALQLVATF